MFPDDVCPGVNAVVGGAANSDNPRPHQLGDGKRLKVFLYFSYFKRPLVHNDLWSFVTILTCGPFERKVLQQKIAPLWTHPRSAPNEDHHCSVAAAIQKPPSDWKRPIGRPNHIWLRAIEADMKLLNINLSSACKNWRSVVDTATLK